MNTKELMIGNWVFVDKIGKPAIIREVYANGVMTNIANNVLAKEISPLPLTKEILDYNGFKAKIGAGGLFQITVSGVCCEVDFNIIHYVHELQQALLICGVNKEIKIEGVETTNDKDLLITDLSGRIPFGVIAELYDKDIDCALVMPSRRPSGLRKTTSFFNSLAHRTTWLRSDLTTKICSLPICRAESRLA